MNYRRARIPGATYFFTVTLRDRRSRLLTEHAGALREAIRAVLIGALGGLVLPMAFAFLLDWTGVWASCWLVLAVISVICLIWMHGIFRRAMRAEAPDLLTLLERRPLLGGVAPTGQHRSYQPRLTARLHHSVPLFRDLNDQAFERLAEIGEERAVPPRTELFREGDPGDALYCILETAR